MAKYLNLDELLGEVGKVTFKGTDYAIPEIEVGQFVRLLKAQQAAEQSEDETKALDTAKALIAAVVPDMGKAKVKSDGEEVDLLDTLTLRQLRALMQFIVEDVQGSTDDEDDEGNATGGAAKGNK